VIRFLKDKKIKTYAADLTATEGYFQSDFSQPTALIAGDEATGLSQDGVEAADERIQIPMLGRIDSLNVSVSAAILLYEAIRQRTAKG